jgi:hypothetical protein
MPPPTATHTVRPLGATDIGAQHYTVFDFCRAFDSASIAALFASE